MKLVCDCGNEDIFNTIDRETGEETEYCEDEGQYATIRRFSLWENHDVVGIECDKCKKAVWVFT